MDIHGNLPIQGKYPPLDEKFNKWWKITNSLGVGGFIMFLSCLGTGEHKYYCALLSMILFMWALLSASREFPKLVRSMQTSNNLESKLVAKLITNEYIPILKKPHLFLPFWLGLSSLNILAAYPLLSGDPSMYFPIFKN